MHDVQLKNLASLLSDNHQEIMEKLIAGKETMDQTCLEQAAELMQIQSSRMLFVANEVREISRKNNIN